MILRKVDYSTNSPHGAVQACLRRKQQVVRQISGIGPHSCCSFLSFLRPDGRVDNVFGNSRIRVPYQVEAGGRQVKVACAHGELTALWNAIEDVNGIPNILEMYIEMSPCQNCMAALQNLLPLNTVVLYSFDHPAETGAWETAATALCR